MTLYKWQKTAIERFKNAAYFCLNVCCGGGKTAALIEIMKHKQKPVIIIAPKSICEQWKNALLQEGINEADVWVHDQQTMTKDRTKYLTKFQEFIK